MAGDWIQIEVDLPKQRKVMAIGRRANMSPYEVVGRLVDFWGWFTAQPYITNQDGDVGAVVDVDVDALVGAGVGAGGDGREFFRAMISERWLIEGTHDGRPALLIPKFDSWLSKSSKARRQKAIRQLHWRQSKKGPSTAASTPASTTPSTQGATRVDVSKREEVRGKKEEKEDKKTPYSPPRGTTTKYSSAFEEFWSTYPPQRRQGKKAAFKCYLAAIRQVAADQSCTYFRAESYLQERIAEFAVSPLGQCEYCPGPSPWLNQGRWLDAVEVWQRKSEQAPVSPPRPSVDIDELMR